jgi:hypothetical protein
LRDVLRTDFLARAGAMGGPIGAAIAVAGFSGILPLRDGRGFMPAQGLGLSVAFAAAFLVLGAALVAWRVARIRSAFASNRRAPGRVTRLRPFKDRAYVHYAYEVNGRELHAMDFVHQTEAFRRLAEGQPVTVAFDPRRPSVAFVAELFDVADRGAGR